MDDSGNGIALLWIQSVINNPENGWAAWWNHTVILTAWMDYTVILTASHHHSTIIKPRHPLVTLCAPSPPPSPEFRVGILVRAIIGINPLPLPGPPPPPGFAV